MLYDTAKGPPKPGSILEILFLMVQMRREATQLYGTHAMIQAIRSIMDPETANDPDGESVKDAFNRYRNSLMPFVKEQVKKEEDEIVHALRAEAMRGPMKVTPIGSPGVQSRIASRVKQHLNQAAVGGSRWSSAHGAVARKTRPSSSTHYERYAAASARGPVHRRI